MIKTFKKPRVYFLPLISTFLILALLLEPTECVAAAKTGLLLWFNTVLPSLLPFIIGANVLLASGSIYFFEKIFQPIMKPIFKVPGCCAFPWIMGLISGYPMGAKLTAELRKNKQITDVQTQRLLSFCNNSGPFFILGAVGIGMLGDEQLGYFLLLIHFISSLLVGIIFRFYGRDNASSTTTFQSSLFKPANSIGEVLGSSITNSMEVIMQIGGYIIIFSVIGALVKKASFIKAIANALYFIFQSVGMTTELALSWIIGIIEMSNGVHMVSMVQSSQSLKLAIISFLLAWGGLSIHAQSLNLLQNITIKTPIYLLAKFLHGVIAFILTLFLFPIYINYTQKLIPTFAISHYKYFPIIGFCFIIFAFILSMFAIKVEQ